jgi:hypothetical protein
MSEVPQYRYRAAIHRRIPLEPTDDPATTERITVHAANATHARLLIRAVTGAVVVLEPERIGDAPARPLSVDAHLLAGAGVDRDVADRAAIALASNAPCFVVFA